MFNVSLLLLDDTLLKCVVTAVVLFSIVAFKTFDLRSETAKIKCYNYKHETNALAYTFKAGSWQI